jgi:sucrose-6-phosphate hydrolase SacC (GH32 family)
MKKKWKLWLVTLTFACMQCVVWSETPLNVHLMHPGPVAHPADPNFAFYINETYHLFYLYERDRQWAFAHVTSSDMLHWTWRPSGLDQDLIGVLLTSGTGFMTKEGRPAIVAAGYKAQPPGFRILYPKDDSLTSWHEPQVIQLPKTKNFDPAHFKAWDPDIFLDRGIYYLIAGTFDPHPQVFKSPDLKTWEHMGDFFSYQPADVLMHEDTSCPNFFRLGDQWMLSLISHYRGCRYYLGNWTGTQFVPTSHARMNWRPRNSNLVDSTFEFAGRKARDWRIFAPESVLTPDGRRVMWAWLAGISGDARCPRGIQSFPRELDVSEQGDLLIRPLREIESLRYAPQSFSNINIPYALPEKAWDTVRLADLDDRVYEIRAVLDRKQIARKRCGFYLFMDEGSNTGYPVFFQPDSGTMLVGDTEAPFRLEDLPGDVKNITVRILIDEWLVEVFVADRLAMVGKIERSENGMGLGFFSERSSNRIDQLDIWKLHPTNQGFLEARASGAWQSTEEER